MIGFTERLKAEAAEERLVVQPRMGFAAIDEMRAGLRAVRDGVAGAVGTLTIDAYTRVGQEARAESALRAGAPLNGFPITVHGPDATRAMLEGVADATFPVQIRHGAAFPQRIFAAAAAAGVLATEGGPISYNLPYSRAAISDTVVAWREAADIWAAAAERTGEAAHLESFGGCMYGQLCPPELLIALSILEALFFARRGVPSVSVSLAQGSSPDQDVGGLIALGRIAGRRLAGVDWSRVFYSFMGLFPETPAGAERLIRDSARIARIAGCERLIVKTAAEARGIPSIEENVAALGWARASADAANEPPDGAALAWADWIEAAAEALIDDVLAGAPEIGDALARAFDEGRLDVPFCVHPGNRGAAQARVDPETGAVIWVDPGAMAIPDGGARGHPPMGHSPTVHTPSTRALTADSFRQSLYAVRRAYDAPDTFEQGDAP